MKTLRILLVEDSKALAKTCAQPLLEAGHEVTYIVGAKSLSPLVGMGFKGEEVVVDPRQFDLAFCDGQLKGKHEGPAIVRELAAAGLACIGTSTNPDHNTQMCEAGAVLGLGKVAVMSALVAQKVGLEQVRQWADGIRPQQAAFEQTLLADTALFALVEARLEGFVQEEVS